MADKKALFAGRTGDKASKFRPSPNRGSSMTPTAPGSGEKSRPLSFGKSGFGKGVAATLQRREIQVKEAEAYLKQANKMLTKTMTRWNPDFFSAAPLFEQAGACYRAAGEDGKATAMYMQAGECQCHESVNAHASAAKDFREAALITERQGRKDEAAALYLRCAEAWVHADEPGRSADYFGRSAKLVKDTDESAAAERYIFASKIMVPKGSDSRTNFVRVVGGVDILVEAISFLASTDRLEQSLEVVSRYIILLEAEGIEHSLGRMYLTYCVLALALGDYVMADTAFRDVHLQNTLYLRSEECRVEEELLTAFKDYRPDLLRKAQGDRTLRRLDTAIVRIAQSLSVSGDGVEAADADDYDDDQDAIPARETPSGTIAAAQARARALKEKYDPGSGGSGSEGGTALTESAAAAKPSSPPLSAGVVGGDGAASAPPVPPPRPTPASVPPYPSPPNPKNTSERTTATQAAAAVSEAARAAPAPPLRARQEEDPELARDALFGGSRKPTAKAKASPDGAPAPAASPAADTAAARSSVSAAAAGLSGSPASFPESPVGGQDTAVDLGLEDLEASLRIGTEAERGGDDDDDDLEAMIEAARKEATALGLGGEGAEEESDDEDDDIDLT